MTTSGPETASAILRARGRQRAAITLIAASLLLVFLIPSRACADDHWFVTAYGGQLSGGRNGDVVKFKTQESYLAGLGLLWEFEQSPPHVRWEVEGVSVAHFGEQEHVEFAASINVRWITFPWDAYVDTSVAFGSGLSYATEEPAVEARDNPETGTARLLHYIMLEAVVGIPALPRWGLVARLHHRSGVFGLFDGVGRASNAFLLGVRFRF